MKFYSDVLRKLYDTDKELFAAEAAHEAELAEQKAKAEEERKRKEALAAEKESRKKEVDAAYDIAFKAYEAAEKKAKEFANDYGRYQRQSPNAMNTLYDIIFGL